jgi:hypothetical protein
VLIAAVVVASALCFGVIATGAERSRVQAAQAVRTQTEPLLVQAATMYTALSDANATATTTFLRGGLEPPALRARYLQDLRVASDSLATLTREVGGSADTRTAVRTVTEQLPVYSGLVETARANNRQGFPVGAAYLRNASQLLTATILPNADRLYAIESSRLSAGYSTGMGALALVILILAVVVSLGLLILAQVYVARLSRRNLNLGMLLATGVLVAVSIWAVAGLIREQNALARGRRSSDSVEVLSATKVLFSRAQSDQSLTLVNRGSDETDPTDFRVVMRALAPPRGLLGEVTALARGAGTTAAANRLVTSFVGYRVQTAQVAALEKSGQLSEAIKRASSVSSIADRLNRGLAAQIAGAQARFALDAAGATSALSGLSFAIPVLSIFAAALALIGLRPRLGEYR